MSATSADQGRGPDVDRVDKESQPGLGSTEGHRITPAPENFTSSSVPANASDNADRPLTAFKLPINTEHAESSKSKSKPGNKKPPVEHTPPSPTKTTGKQTEKENKKPSPTTASEPSGPVLVNPGLPTPSSSTRRSTSAMQLALSPSSALPHSIRGPKSKINPQRPSQTLPQAPSPSSFSFASILTSLSTDPTTQSDIDAIAEICSRSRLSMANEYTAHREPVGPGNVDQVHIASAPDFDDPAGTADDSPETQAQPQPQTQRLVLDTTTAAALYRSPTPLGAGAVAGGGPGPGLETVDEAPTPLSSGSRGNHQLGGPPDTYGSNSANPSQSPTASAASEDPGIVGRWGFLDVWERGGARGAASRSVLGLERAVAVGEGEGFGSSGLDGRVEVRENVSGGGGGRESRAVRQLMRVAGG